VPDEVLALIAERVTSNIRELEGALIRIIAFASLNECDVTLELVDSILHDIVGARLERRGLSIDLIKKVTAEYYSIKIEEMDAKIRTKEIATARQVAMYLVRDMTSASLPKIGEEFGGRDHTTVLHANEKIKNSMRTDRDIREAVETIANNLKRYS
jgi:chromosomal replication initiator protein